MKLRASLIGTILLLAAAVPASATIISVDEYGTGLRSDTGGTLAINAGPYTVSHPLTYTLPWTVSVGGILELCEERSGDCEDKASDIIMFTKDSNLLKFWSGAAEHDDPEPGVLADTGLPEDLDISFHKTEVALTGLGSGFWGYIWTPTDDQPGYAGSKNAASYVLASDGKLTRKVPEPASIAIILAGLGGLNRLRRRRKTQA